MAIYDEEQDKRVTKIARKQPDVALALAKDLVFRFPQASRSWASLAFAYTIKKDDQNALHAMQSALMIEPDNIANLFDVSLVNIRLNMCDHALKNLSQCIKISKYIENSYYLEACYLHIVFCHCKLGNFDFAQKELKHISDDAKIWIGRLLTKPDLEEACRQKRLD